MLIDSHCHLNFKSFQGKVNQVIDEADKRGVKVIVVPGTNIKTSKKSLQLAKDYQQVYSAVGIHPHHAGQIVKELGFKRLKKELEKLAGDKKVVAIGETGLDYYHYQKTKYKDYQINDQFKKIQKKLFLLQIDLASQLNLPLIIHNRQASADILKLFVSNSSLPNSKSRFFKGVFLTSCCICLS